MPGKRRRLPVTPADFDPLMVGKPLPRREIVKRERPTEAIEVKPKRKVGSGRRSANMNGTLASVCAMLRGGKATLLNLIRITASSGNTDAANFLAHYDALQEKAKLRISFEDLCTECGFPWPRLVGWAFEAAASTGQHLAAMKASLALPEVVDASIKFAMKKDGHRDRDFLYQHTGFTPTPTGASISIVNQASANAQAKNGNETSFVPFEQDVIDVDSEPNV